MWQCSALLVSCVLAFVLAVDEIYDRPKEYIERIRRSEVSIRRPARKSSVAREVKSGVVPNRRVSGSFRGTRNTLYPLEASQFQHNVGQTGPDSGLVVQSSRINIEVPPSRRYYNPALKKTPYPFQLPLEGPYPFQSTAFGGLYPLEVPTASGLELQDDLLPTTGAAFSPTAIASIPPTSTGNFDFTSPGFVAESWRSFQHTPATAPSAVPNFSTRPPWIPRPGKSDFKTQRGNLQTVSASGNQINTMTKKIPTVTAGNVSELIKMVEQLIIASNQNTTSTNTTALPVFRQFFKHPSVG